MTLNADNVINVGRGGAGTSSTSTAIAITLDASGTTAADSVVFVGLFGAGLTFTTPAGWAVVQASSNGMSVYRRGPVEGLAAGESSWNFTPSATSGTAVVGAALEITGIDPATTVDVIGTLGLHTSGTSVGPTISGGATYDGLAVGLFAHRSSTSGTPATWASYQASNSATTLAITEVLQQGQTGTGNSVALAAAVVSVATISIYSLVGAPTPSPTSASPAVTFGFVINAIGARKQSDLFMIDGTEHGTVVGNTLGTAGKKILSTATAGATVSTASARSGTYGWEFTSTAAACNVVKETVALATTGLKPAYRRCFNLNGEGTQRRLWRITMTTTTAATVNVDVWVLTSGLLACIIGATQVDSGQTVPASGWFAVDLRFDCSGHVAGVSSTRTAEWMIDYDASLTDTTGSVAQAIVSVASTVAGNVSTFTETVGWAGTVTSTLYSDDGGAAPGHNYPIGDLRVLPLLVDAAGTVTVGTSTNFGQTVNNGTAVTAFNAATFRDAAREMPPVLTASRKAALAILAHATDNANIPMETYDLAGNKVAARGARSICATWAASTTASTMRVFVYDGTTEHTIYAEADPNADNTATPAWIAGVIKTGSAPVLWGQAVVDALATRFGSNDGNPDIGGNFMLELAVVKAQPESLFGSSGDPVYVEAYRDPATYALVGATVTNNSGDAVKLAWEVDGTPADSGSIPNGTAGQYVPLSADGSIETVNQVSLIPG